MYVCRSLFVLLSFFLLAIVLSVILRFMDSDYPFGIFKLFLSPLCFLLKLLYHARKVSGLVLVC